MLTRKLEKRPAWLLAKSSQSEEEERAPIQSEASDEEVNSKKGTKLKIGGSPSLMTVRQIQELIANTVMVWLGRGAHKTHLYAKPFTKRIDALYMPRGYQPQKFQQFDRKGNPKQHVAYFMKTCSNDGTDGGLMIKQFIRTPMSITSNWYTYLELKSIYSSGKMDHEFLNKFYNSRCNQHQIMEGRATSLAGARLASSARTSYLKPLLWRCALRIWHGDKCHIFMD